GRIRIRAGTRSGFFPARLQNPLVHLACPIAKFSLPIIPLPTQSVPPIHASGLSREHPDSGSRRRLWQRPPQTRRARCLGGSLGLPKLRPPPRLGNRGIPVRNTRRFMRMPATPAI